MGWEFPVDGDGELSIEQSALCFPPGGNVATSCSSTIPSSPPRPILCMNMSKKISNSFLEVLLSGYFIGAMRKIISMMS